MNGSYDCHPQTFADIHDFKLVLDIQMVCRFVKNKAFCLLCERSGKYDTLLFPSGKSGKISFAEFFQSYATQSVPRNFIVFRIVPLHHFLMG